MRSRSKRELGDPGTTRTKRQDSGDRAEQAAAEFLASNGLKPLLRNYRCKLGELDIIAIDGNVLAVVEVRMRSSDNYGGSAASVNNNKQQKLVKAAQHFLQLHPQFARLPMRFDVVAVTDLDSGRPRIDWLKHAFEVT